MGVPNRRRAAGDVAVDSEDGVEGAAAGVVSAAAESEADAVVCSEALGEGVAAEVASSDGWVGAAASEPAFCVSEESTRAWAASASCFSFCAAMASMRGLRYFGVLLRDTQLRSRGFPSGVDLTGEDVSDAGFSGVAGGWAGAGAEDDGSSSSRGASEMMMGSEDAEESAGREKEMRAVFLARFRVSVLRAPRPMRGTGEEPGWAGAWLGAARGRASR